MNNLLQKTEKKSLRTVQENTQALIDLFPEIYKDGKIHLDILKTLIGEEAESYQFLWPGKRKAMNKARKHPQGTLHPLQDKSVHWEDTENLYIEGDNLAVLKILETAYQNQIKMMYIDPPYNTGNKLIYLDEFSDHMPEDEKASPSNRARSSPEKMAERQHTNWLNMMYPRLTVARKLLRDDGVIFISIDERELANLKKICDEIFGEDNFIEIFVWRKTNTPPSLSHKSRKTVEYILCYEKKRSSQKYKGELLDYGDVPLLNTGNHRKPLTFPARSIHFNIPDGTYKTGVHGRLELVNDLIVEKGLNKNDVQLIGEFKWIQATVDEEITKGTYFLIKTKRFSIRFQRQAKDNQYKAPTNLLDKSQTINIGTNETASNELKALGLKRHFDYPKPVGLIKYLLRATTEKDDLIMDFFAGSSTTAQAVMELNEEDGGQRNFIMVQIPDLTAIESEAYNNGFKNLCEIGRERIVRAGQKIQSATNNKKTDIGFKVFQQGETNFTRRGKEENNTSDWQELIRSGRTEEDVLYEILLQQGIHLTVSFRRIMIGKKLVYISDQEDVVVCLDFGLTVSLFKHLTAKFPEIQQMIVFAKAFHNSHERLKTQTFLKKLAISMEEIV